MSQAVQINSIVSDLSRAAVAADALHRSLCNAGAPDAALEAPLRDYAAAMAALTETRCATHAELRDKARALNTCLLDGEIRGDFGLAASLIRDVLS